MPGVEIPARMSTLHEYRQMGGSIAAVFPIHYPRELLRAHNILPVEVWGPPNVGAGYGETHLQPYICSIVRNALSFTQSGGLDLVDLLLVPHACDSLQGLGSLLIDFIPVKQPVLTLYLPRGRRDCDLEFLASEICQLSHRLEQVTGYSPSEAELMECISREEQADGLLSQLHLKHQQIPLDDEAFYRLVRSREYLPAEKFITLAAEMLSKAVEQKPAGIPILLSGILPEPMTLFRSFSEMGARVVADDFACCGRRLYPAGQSQDVFRHMAERIMNAPPDTMRGNSIKERLDHLLSMLKTSGARGVVFYNVKFCEPELFYLPNLRRGLAQADIPSITVEVDISEGLTQPVLNRLEAFLEMIQ